MQVLFKATGELAKGSVEGVGNNTWLTIHPYYHIVAVIILSLCMLSYLNLLLARTNAVIATPLYFTNLIVCSSTMGLIFYKEYREFSVWQWILFPLGILIVISGVAFMSLKGIDLNEFKKKEIELQAAKEYRQSLRRSAQSSSSGQLSFNQEKSQNNDNMPKNTPSLPPKVPSLATQERVLSLRMMNKGTKNATLPRIKPIESVDNIDL